jgi:hypothetical protein
VSSTSFKVGDRVTVIAADPENAGTEGRTGTVYSIEPGPGGLIAVKGIDGRVSEAVKGYRAYTADQLRKA